MSRVIYACDVGSVQRGGFAWARVVPGTHILEASSDIVELVARLVQDAKNGRSIALGFECPLFMPVPDKSSDLGCARKGEGNRPMFAVAGATAAAFGIQQAAWILCRLRDKTENLLTYTLDWGAWPPQNAESKLLLWEAFVSGPAHGRTDRQDAATAATFFREHETDLDGRNAVTTLRPLNLLHAVALFAGWANDSARLHVPCLVLKPDGPYDGSIGEAEAVDIPPRTPECVCCWHNIPVNDPRMCPKCDHVFKGKGWEGIDAHWRSHHDDEMPYEDFWRSLCPRHR